jgi:hypothetical protein
LDRKECLEIIMQSLTTWREDDEEMYYSGKHIPDETTLAVAARSGNIRFVEFCKVYYSQLFHNETVVLYAWESNNTKVIQCIENTCNSETLIRARAMRK